MVIAEQSYRGTHDIWTESPSLLIIHHKCVLCDKFDGNSKPPVSADFPTVRNKEEIMK